MAHEPDDIAEAATLLLHAERLNVAKKRQTEHVAVRTETRQRDVVISEPLNNDYVEVEHVFVGKFVDEMPTAREEGGATILPIVEEVAVVVRRLFLREEIHIRKIRTSTTHVETVTVREQHAIVTRTPRETSTNASALDVPLAQSGEQTTSRDQDMNTEETIVAVYDTPAHAELAVNDLRQAMVPEAAITRHEGAAAGGAGTSSVREKGFWSSLFGGDTYEDEHIYEHSAQMGSSVVAVRAPLHEVDSVMAILESHAPIDIDERKARYEAASGVTVTAPTTAGDDTMSLAAESLVVGKRLVNRGGTRLRRYVVETPVEEKITLHSETIQVDRRPVVEGAAVADPDFSEKVIEMTATAEEAVVGKTAHVVEEVSLRKEASDRVETIHGTVRREDVEVEQIPGDVVTEQVATAPLDPRAPKKSE